MFYKSLISDKDLALLHNSNKHDRWTLTRYLGSMPICFRILLFEIVITHYCIPPVLNCIQFESGNMILSNLHQTFLTIFEEK